MAPPPPTARAVDVDALELGAIGTNCYVVRATGSSDGVVVDPGDEPDRVLQLLRERGLQLRGILVTHCHYDHVGAVAALVEATGAPVWMSGIEAPVLEQPEQYRFAGLPTVRAARVDHRLDGGERIELGGLAFEVLATPGHSPGHLTFVLEGVAPEDGSDGQPPVAFVGDVLFRGSVGRTDLPFADAAQLEESLRLLVDRLAPQAVVLSGHGPPTTIADERRHNPFLRGI